MALSGHDKAQAYRYGSAMARHIHTAKEIEIYHDAKRHQDNLPTKADRDLFDKWVKKGLNSQSKERRDAREARRMRRGNKKRRRRGVASHLKRISSR